MRQLWNDNRRLHGELRRLDWPSRHVELRIVVHVVLPSRYHSHLDGTWAVAVL
jgi:hypothetical protein